jgi:hypothetical protein
MTGCAYGLPGEVTARIGRLSIRKNGERTERTLTPAPLTEPQRVNDNPLITFTVEVYRAEAMSNRPLCSP